MGYIDHRRRKPLVKLTDLEPHSNPKRGIKIGQRLIKEKCRWLTHNRTANGNPLALAAGKLSGTAVKIIGKVQNRRRFLDPPRLLGPVQPRHAQGEGNVLANRHMRIERIGLEYHGKAALGRRYRRRILAIDQNLTRGHVFKSGDQAQQGGFTTPRWPDKYDKLAFLDLEVQRGNDLDIPKAF